MSVRFPAGLIIFCTAGILFAGDTSEVRVPVPQSPEFRMEAEFRFGASKPHFSADAWGRLEATADPSDSAIEIKLEDRGRPVATETEHLKPVVRKGWGAGVEEDLAREAAAMPGWKDRWFPVRIDVDEDTAWFWFDGRAIARVRRTVSISGIVLRSAGGEVRNARVTRRASQRGGYQTVDLRGYANGDGAPGVPTGDVQVGGVPFEVNGRPIDLSRTGLRLRKKPTGPGSLYGNPFNFVNAMDGDPLTMLLRVPKRYYRKAWLLCGAAEGGEGARATVRLARYRGEGGVFFADSPITVPRFTGTPVKSSPPSIPFSQGRLWLVEVPLDPGAMQDNLAADVLQAHGNPSEVLKLDAGVPWMEIELSRSLRADLNCMLPLGGRSSVRIYGLTLEESPFKMVAFADAEGNLFETGQRPRFRVYLENTTVEAQAGSLEVRVRDHNGVETRSTQAVALSREERRTQPVDLAAMKPGKYDVYFHLRDATGQTLVKRATTMGVLPPDTRKAERDSPFGLWSWGGGHLTSRNEVEAHLMRRAGARFTLGVKYPSKQRYGIGTGTDSVIGVFYSSQKVPAASAEAAAEMVETMKTRGSNPLYWQIYWEDDLSSRHHGRYPPSMIDRPPMELNEAEQARLKAYWDRAESYAREARKQLPREKLALGAFPSFTEEFLRRGFPKHYLDAISLETTCYRMQPERQPQVDNVHALYFIEEWKKRYGYQDLDTILVESLFHGTAPGYLSERDQANYYVRDFLLALSYGVKLFGMSAMITDVSNDYYRSSWGNVGLCHRAPEPSPKESYIAFATMTSMLDQARFAGSVDTGTTSVYALHFIGKDGRHIYPMWTTRGERPVEVEFGGTAKATVIDAMHVRTPLRGTRVVVTESPVYVESQSVLAAVRAGVPQYKDAPPRTAAPVAGLRTLDGWRPRSGRSALLEDGNPRYPRRAGDVRFSAVTDTTAGVAVEVTAKSTGGSPLLPMYGVLEPDRPLRISGEPKRLGLQVRGNSGWGRITFELIDAKGERWTGAGGSEDAYGHGFINFDGWRWLEVDLPGHFRPDYPWPQYGNWTPSGGDGQVDYPLSLAAVIVEMRDHVVYVNSLVPVREAAIRLRDLRAVY